MKMKRLPTMVRGLDEILNGGLFAGGVYILEGPPGVGKTTLANQMAYTFARSEVRTLYVTMLAESHARMLQHMEGQEFFDQRQVNSKVFYISGYRELEKDGLKGVKGLLLAELARHGASLLVIDGLVVHRDHLNADESARQFVHELQSLVSAMSCTCLLLTSGNGNGNAMSAEQTMVDGIFVFEDHGFHWRAERRMQVRKFRGSQVIRGSHTFCITDKGLQFFPRLESLPFEGEDVKRTISYVSTGLPTIDEALAQNGVISGSASIVIGASGTGKTSFALAFASRATSDEPALFLSGMEIADDLRRAGLHLGIAIGEAIDAEGLKIEPLGLEDESMDEIGHKILRLVDELHIRRLVVDGLAGMADTLAFPERGYRFLGRLLVELRNRGVTSLFTIDPAALAVAAGTSLAEGVMGLFDNIFSFVKPAAEISQNGSRLIEITKVRTSHATPSAVNVQFTPLDSRPSSA